MRVAGAGPSVRRERGLSPSARAARKRRATKCRRADEMSLDYAHDSARQDTAASEGHATGRAGRRIGASIAAAKPVRRRHNGGITGRRIRARGQRSRRCGRRLAGRFVSDRRTHTVRRVTQGSLPRSSSSSRSRASREIPFEPGRRRGPSTQSSACDAAVGSRGDLGLGSCLPPGASMNAAVVDPSPSTAAVEPARAEAARRSPRHGGGRLGRRRAAAALDARSTCRVPRPTCACRCGRSSSPTRRSSAARAAHGETPASIEPNPPIYVYDTSGPYTDPSRRIDIRSGLPPLRAAWIAERDDTEELSGPTSRTAGAPRRPEARRSCASTCTGCRSARRPAAT